MADMLVKGKLVLTNPKALRALKKIANTLVDLEEDLPWREDVKEAVKAARYAFTHLDLK